jgi:cytidine deaminase
MKNIDLVAKAKHARQHAYAPYSNFQVGAALLTKDGRVFEGCNVENSTYGLAVCAERTAVVSAVAAGVKDFEKIAIVVDTPKPAAPCGMCLQTLAEFEPDLALVLSNLKGDMEETTLRVLMPRQFKL